jgi:O-antigen ligase
MFIGCLAAFYLLVGRWTLSRMDNQIDTDWYREPRIWTLLILAVVVLLDQSVLASAAAKLTKGKTKLGMCVLTVLVLFGYLILSAQWAPNPMLAEDKAYELILVAATLLVLFLCLRQHQGDAIRTEFWKAIVLLTSMMALVALANVASGRLSILGGGPNTFGRSMGYLVLGTMYLSRRSGLQWIPFWWGLAGLGVLLLLLSGSRGALAAAVAAAGVYQVIDRQPISKKLFLFVGASLAAAVILTQTEYGRKAQEAFAYRVLYLTVERQHNSGRTEVYLQALQLGMDNPVSGVGLNGCRTYIGIYPHNIFLEVFSEGGAIGLGLFLLYLLTAGLGLLRIGWRLNAAAVAAAAHAFTAAQFSGDLYDSRSIFLFLAFALIPESGSSPGTPRPKPHGRARAVPAPHRNAMPASVGDRAANSLCRRSGCESQRALLIAAKSLAGITPERDPSLRSG